MIQSAKENGLARPPAAGLLNGAQMARQTVPNLRPTDPKSNEAEDIGGSVTRGVDGFEAVFTPENAPGKITLRPVDQINNLRAGH